jgi:hypothetical protein
MDEKVDNYIKKQKSPQKEICQKLREIILKTIPQINEEMKVGVPCYGHAKDDLCGKFYIAALKDHVNLGFSLKGLSKKEQELFEGNGKTMKHIKIYSLEEIDEKKIITLLKLIKEK